MGIDAFTRGLWGRTIDRRLFTQGLASFLATLLSPISAGAANTPVAGAAPLEPGWYKSPRAATGPGAQYWIAHYVRPGARFEHRPHDDGKRRVRRRKLNRDVEIMQARGMFRPATSTRKLARKLVVREAGQVAGATAIKREKLVRLRDDELPVFDGSMGRRLNLDWYSEGIEALALEHWQGGRRDQALATLRVGLTYAARDDSLNIRLYDLLAGLLVRAGRDAELAALAAELQPMADGLAQRIGALDVEIARKPVKPRSRQPANQLPWTAADVEIARLEEQGRQLAARLGQITGRLENWRADSSKWKAKWRSPERKWAGIDI
jgi:hypothetical protein